MKIRIKNRAGKIIVGDLLYNKTSQVVKQPLMIISHGFLGTKNQSFFKRIADDLFKEGIASLRFDFTNSIGESEGDLTKATLTGYIEDLEDVLNYARSLDFVGSIGLIGHSLGGFITIIVSARHKVGCVVSLSASFYTDYSRLRFFAGKEINLDEWREDGFLRVFSPLDNKYYNLSYDYYLDSRNYDLSDYLPKVSHILVIHGTKDKVLGVENAKLIYEHAAPPKKLFIIDGLHHNYYKEPQLTQAVNAILEWVKEWMVN